MKVKVVQECGQRKATPISFEQPDAPKLDKGNPLEFKLCASPADADSATHSLTINYFNNGLPEELLCFLCKVKKAMTGQNITTGMNKYTLMRCLLIGNALTAFKIN